MKYNVYYKNNSFRKTNLSRKEAIDHYNFIKIDVFNSLERHIHIYCPNRDFYVDKYFLPQFLNLEDPFGQLMFDHGATLLSKVADGVHRWRDGDKIVYSTPQGITETIPL